MKQFARKRGRAWKLTSPESSCATTVGRFALVGGPAAGVDGRERPHRQLHRRNRRSGLRPTGFASGGKVSPRSGDLLAWPGDAQLVSAVRDDGPSRPASRGRRGHDLPVPGRRGVRVADVDPRLAATDSRLRLAARNHAHDLRQPFPPAAAPLGRRRRGHQRRVTPSSATSTARCCRRSSAAAAASPSTRCSP